MPNNTFNIVVAALYKFVRLEETSQLRQNFLKFCHAQNITGTLLIAREGLNGTLAGTRDAMTAFQQYLAQDSRFNDLEYKESYAEKMPFYRLKIKLKKEIVTLGVEGVDPTQQVGTYVEAEDWNQLMADPDVILIDTRNAYEVAIGTFKKALNPNTKSFRQFPAYVQKNLDPKKHKKIAMMCTGGIRCEKASSYMLQAGFEEVYHLKGGILKYLEKVPAAENLWQGNCFVFDQRTAVGVGLELSDFSNCHACRHPLSASDRASPHYQAGTACPFCYDSTNDVQKQRFIERQRQCDLANARGKKHFGVGKSLQ
ncbi:MAG: rhodanese-related sulfurtransferase [Janthinobacterium lividum]